MDTSATVRQRSDTNYVYVLVSVLLIVNSLSAEIQCIYSGNVSMHFNEYSYFTRLCCSWIGLSSCIIKLFIRYLDFSPLWQSPLDVSHSPGTGKMRLVRPPASDASSVVRAGLGLWIAAQMCLGLEMLRDRHTVTLDACVRCVWWIWCNWDQKCKTKIMSNCPSVIFSDFVLVLKWLKQDRRKSEFFSIFFDFSEISEKNIYSYLKFFVFCIRLLVQLVSSYGAGIL